MAIYSTKKFDRFPIAHRDCYHDGNCALVHGYSLSFEVTFACKHQNKSGHVMDYGQLKEVKNWLNQEFDHTLWLNEDDPFLPEFRELEKAGACSIRLGYRICMEETARYVLDNVDKMVRRITNDRVWVVKVQAWENDVNSAIVTVD